MWCLWAYLVTFVLMVGAGFDDFVGLVISGFGFWLVVLEVWVCRLLGLVRLRCFGLCYLFLGCFGVCGFLRFVVGGFA